MKIENIWAGIIAFFVSAVMLIGFGTTIFNLMNIVDSEIKIFVGVLIIITFSAVGFFFPLEILISDDKGRVN